MGETEGMGEHLLMAPVDNASKIRQCPRNMSRFLTDDHVTNNEIGIVTCMIGIEDVDSSQ